MWIGMTEKSNNQVMSPKGLITVADKALIASGAGYDSSGFSFGLDSWKRRSGHQIVGYVSGSVILANFEKPQEEYDYFNSRRAQYSQNTYTLTFDPSAPVVDQTVTVTVNETQNQPGVPFLTQLQNTYEQYGLDRNFSIMAREASATTGAFFVLKNADYFGDAPHTITFSATGTYEFRLSWMFDWEQEIYLNDPRFGADWLFDSNPYLIATNTLDIVSGVVSVTDDFNRANESQLASPWIENGNYASGPYTTITSNIAQLRDRSLSGGTWIKSRWAIHETSLHNDDMAVTFNAKYDEYGGRLGIFARVTGDFLPDWSDLTGYIALMETPANNFRFLRYNSGSGVVMHTSSSTCPLTTTYKDIEFRVETVAGDVVCSLYVDDVLHTTYTDTSASKILTGKFFGMLLSAGNGFSGDYGKVQIDYMSAVNI